ncbi:DEAD/DEAH box helicase [Shewanella psychrotolerans]|uniref:DEAD/DEAH box helicase n=1 Tax=Shewanella psychrotolerans TaxID=2864206 RepID=UPI001C65F320|nr:DEAD/DEAH box helicase [Shewanella psychrotolerans]QYK00475.1 DEAD/DEAH box helicase [Shewanella psychrotolerans]
MLFAQLGLSQPLLDALDKLGFSQATAIQTEAIPAILAKEDLLASAQTGTGKTAAFGLPILQQLLELGVLAQNQHDVKTLILVPTRELALQVQASLQGLSQNTQLRVGIVYGGVSIEAQQASLAKGLDILIATPGRLLDHLNRGSLTLAKLTHLVFDEADRMLDMGFMDEIHALMAQLPSSRQTLLFSATLDDSVLRFSRDLLTRPKRIETDQSNSAAKDIEQRVYAVDSDKKFALLCHLVTKGHWQRVLVFSRKKVAADKLAKHLNEKGIEASAFHGDLGQGTREQVLQRFKAGEIKVLVATDVAARGIDIQRLDYVVNYELPFVAQDYVHRIGRTGRAGNKGVAVTLFSEDDALLLEEIEVSLDKRLPQQWLPGFEPDLTKADPFAGRNSKSAQKRRAKKRGYRSKK